MATIVMINTKVLFMPIDLVCYIQDKKSLIHN